MKLLISIDQKSSIRRGHDAPHSTEPFDLDPGAIPPDLRDFVADHLDVKDGVLSYSFSGYAKSDRLTLIKPISLDAVISAIAAMKAGYDSYVAGREADQQQALAERRTKTEAALLAGPKPAHAALRRYAYSGRIDTLCGSFSKGVPNEPLKITVHDDLDATGVFLYRQIEWPYDSDPEVKERAAALDGMLHEEYVAAKDALALRLEAAYQTEVAKRKAIADAFRAQLDATAREIGGIFHERHLAGFTVDEEIIAVIQANELQRRGLEALADNLGCENGELWSRPLTDEQFLTLKEFKTRLPSDANVSLWKIWDDDEENSNLYVEAAFNAGQVRVIARKMLGAVPSISAD